MKKISFVLSLAFASTLFAQSSATVKLGVTSLDNDDGWKLKNGTFAVDGVYDMGYAIKPRGELTYIKVKDSDKWGGVSSLFQLALGAQYEPEVTNEYNISPYIFGELGYEKVTSGHDYLDSNPFIQAGLGAKYGLDNGMGIVGEFRAFQVFDSNNDSDDEDNEFTFFLGLNFPFNSVSTPAPVVVPMAVPSLPAPEPEPTQVVVEQPEPVSLEAVEASQSADYILDSDDDGLTDDVDACPQTPYNQRKDVDESGCAKGEGTEQAVSVTPTAPEKGIDLHIKFDTNSATIKKESLSQIAQFADHVKNLPKGTIVKIMGYTDSSGNYKKNVTLSQKRASSVKWALVNLGVDSKMLKAYGKGSANPIAQNDTPEGRTQNRRIEAVIELKK